MKHIFTELSGVSLERQQDAYDCVSWRGECMLNSSIAVSIKYETHFYRVKWSVSRTTTGCMWLCFVKGNMFSSFFLQIIFLQLSSVLLSLSSCCNPDWSSSWDFINLHLRMHLFLVLPNHCDGWEVQLANTAVHSVVSRSRTANVIRNLELVDATVTRWFLVDCQTLKQWQKCASFTIQRFNSQICRIANTQWRRQETTQ